MITRLWDRFQLFWRLATIIDYCLLSAEIDNRRWWNFCCLCSFSQIIRKQHKNLIVDYYRQPVARYCRRSATIVDICFTKNAFCWGFCECRWFIDAASTIFEKPQNIVDYRRQCRRSSMIHRQFSNNHINSALKV